MLKLSFSFINLVVEVGTMSDGSKAVLLSSEPLDLSVGMYVYARPEFYLGPTVKFVKNVMGFKVFEIGLEGDIARPKTDEVVGNNVKCWKGSFLRYVLCKENIPTLDAVELVRKVLNSRVSYAGLKDAEGYTCQYITVKCVEGRSYSRYYELLKGKIKMWFSGVVYEPLRRGCLSGNYFEVSLLNVSEEVLLKVDSMARKIHETPIPNYYGYQRFGSVRPVTHVIGKALLRENFEEVIKWVLGNPYPKENPRTIAARKAFEEGRLEEAVKLFPKSLSVEKFLLRKLIEGYTYERAVKSLDPQYLRIYVESYQSYLFNVALSKSILRHESLENFLKKCEVAPLPHPKARLDDRCSAEFIEGLDEEVETLKEASKSSFAKFMSKASREVAFTVKNFSYEYEKFNNVMKLKFELDPSAYATVFLRELTHKVNS
ncbi:MAG: hypothetical protein B7O98_06770 [Zestosphaera tikiterensis]|uniref:TRUD domain-containing protein n=1 Tax=Zestosphaera tikiterensis TaxID=1973259 RepID=A0A2R7Y475_9CREN|nr:MAG: hypothetical protein B7O98_06770 [Zestosphaera tikiterensis]